MAVLENATAKPAVTHYHRIATGLHGKRPVSLMRCQLETGRTHQIRVHMQSSGSTLVGDTLYGKPHLAPAFGRQALHAYRLGLIHPESRKPCDWNSPLPQDFIDLIAQAGIAATSL